MVKVRFCGGFGWEWFVWLWGWCFCRVYRLDGVGWGRFGWVCGRLMENRILGNLWRGWMKGGFDW